MSVRTCPECHTDTDVGKAPRTNKYCRSCGFPIVLIMGHEIYGPHGHLSWAQIKKMNQKRLKNIGRGWRFLRHLRKISGWPVERSA